MSLLQEIQQGAFDSSVDLSNVLRRCLVLAYKLNHQPFKKWVDYELNGYPTEDLLPGYRILRTDSYGHFDNGFKQLHNFPIPPLALPENLREISKTIPMMQGIGYYAAIDDAQELRVPWPHDALVYAQKDIYVGFRLIAAWRSVGVGALRGMLDVVRSRALEFVLEVEAENPAVDQVASGTGPISKDKLNQIFLSVFHNSQVGIGGNQPTFQYMDRQVIPGDLISLKRYLREKGLDDGDLDRLEEALKGERNPEDVIEGKGQLGRWVREAGKKVVDVSVDTGTKILVEAVKSYMGVP